MYKEEGLKSTVSTAAALTATLTFMGGLVLQLKQYLAGKTPYKNNKNVVQINKKSTTNQPK